jgi:hypothetical protein
MKHCDKCNVEIIGDRSNCPLCQSVLVPSEKETTKFLDVEIFPYVPTLYKQHNLFFKLLIFLSIVAVVIGVMVNIMFHSRGWWSLFIVVGVGCLWMELYVAFFKSKNIPKNILHQTILTCVLCVFWDWFTHWRGWSLDYAIPIVYLSAMLAMVFSSKIMNLDVEDYMIYVIIGGLFGITPTVFLLFGLIESVFLSLICVAASIIFLSAVAIFQGNGIMAELKRRLHL